MVPLLGGLRRHGCLSGDLCQEHFAFDLWRALDTNIDPLRRWSRFGDFFRQGIASRNTYYDVHRPPNR